MVVAFRIPLITRYLRELEKKSSPWIHEEIHGLLEALAGRGTSLPSDGRGWITERIITALDAPLSTLQYTTLTPKMQIKNTLIFDPIIKPIKTHVLVLFHVKQNHHNMCLHFLVRCLRGVVVS